MISEFSPTRIMLDADTLLSALENPELFEIYDDFIGSPHIEPCITRIGLFKICNHFLKTNSSAEYFNFLQEVKSLFTICEFDENWLPDLEPFTVGISDLRIALDVLTAHKFNATAIVTHQPAKFNQGRNIPVISIDNLQVIYRFRKTLIELRNLLFKCSCLELPLSESSEKDVVKVATVPKPKKTAPKAKKNKIGIDFSHPSKSYASQWWTIAASRSDFMRRMSGPRSLEGSGQIPTSLASRPTASFQLETAYEPGRSMREYWRSFNPV